MRGSKSWHALIANPLRNKRASGCFRIYRWRARSEPASEVWQNVGSSHIRKTLKRKKPPATTEGFPWAVRGSNSRHSGCKPDARTSWANCPKKKPAATYFPATKAVSSAQESLTSVFGMGTGIASPLWPPAFITRLYRHKVQDFTGRLCQSQKRKN